MSPHQPLMSVTGLVYEIEIVRSNLAVVTLRSDSLGENNLYTKHNTYFPTLV